MQSKLQLCVRLALQIKRNWCWLHFSLEWAQDRRAAWRWSRFRHQIPPCHKLSGLPKGLNDRLMTLRLPLSDKRHATIVNDQPRWGQRRSGFCDFCYTLILLGDFNARVGTDHQTWEGVIGTEGVGKRNSNGLLLLKKCAEHELLITKTVFRPPTRNKTSWMHPHSKHWHLIDYVIVRRKDRQDVRVTKTMCSADCWTDLLSANLNCAFSLHGDHKARRCQRDWKSLSWNKTARGKPSSMIFSAD